MKWGSTFRETVSRHGLRRAVLRSGHNELQRVLPSSLCRIESPPADPYVWPAPENYETRSINTDEFHTGLCEEFKGKDFRWLFARGDVCVASIYSGEVVGYDFYATQATPVREGLVFVPPEGFWYAYTSRTASSHRGSRLARHRWRVARELRGRLSGSDTSLIWWVDVLNLESRAANRSTGTTSVLRGYAGFARVRARWICFASPGCKRLGARFEAAETPQLSKAAHDPDDT